MDPATDGSYAAGGDADEGAAQSAVPAPIAEWAEAVQEVIVHNARNRPYPTLLVAAGVGWVLAAGMPRFVSKTLLNVGSRVVVAKIASALLEST